MKDIINESPTLCSSCINNCKKCSNETQCEICYLEYHIDNNYCCNDINCLTCHINGTCSTCKDEYYLNITTTE